MKQLLTYCCPCHFGLERTLRFEITKIGGQNITVQDGRVLFEGDLSVLAKANLCLSTAERVLIQMGQFPAYQFEDLFQGVKKLPWEEFIGKQDAFPVTGHALDSTLHSVPDCQSIIKKAIVTRLQAHYSASWLMETGPIHQVQFTIRKNLATIYLDTSGIGLHKRGYRKHANAAPIKETLAAGIVDLAHVRSDSIVCDPFCGSGTFLIEAAFKAMHIAPGLNRRFRAETWDCFPQRIWQDARAEAIAAIRKDAAFEAYGWDNDPEAIALTEENVRKAGVKPRIQIMQRDIADFTPPDAQTITICNPPYGERLLDLQAAQSLYRIMGEVFPVTKEHTCYIISPDQEFETYFEHPATKKRKLYNGMIPCQLYMYF